MRRLVMLLTLAMPACGGLPFPDPTPDPGTGYDCAAPESARCGNFFRSEAWSSGRVVIELKRQLSPQGGLAPLSVSQVQSLATSLEAKLGLQNVRAFGHVNLVAADVANLAGVAKLLKEGAVCNVSAERIWSLPEQPAAAPQEAALTWGIDAVDQRAGQDGQYNPRGAGEGIHVVVLDTGITPHPDFSSRLSSECFTAFASCQDGHGHGTHVSGTIGGKTWGVAKKVTLHSAKVLSDQGSGSTSQVIAGIDWMIALKQQTGWDVVGSMSLGGSADEVLDAALCRAHEAGIPVAIAAGNDYKASACGVSPARVKQQVTVMATTSGDSLASFSNVGPCTDILAPGQDIRSAKPGGGWQDMSGTSMATPHVAGALAICLGLNPGSGVACIDTVLGWATQGRIEGVPADSPNAFEYVGPS